MATKLGRKPNWTSPRARELWRSAFNAGQRVSKKGLDYRAALALGHQKAVKKRLLGPEYEAWMYTYVGAMMG